MVRNFEGSPLCSYHLGKKEVLRRVMAVVVAFSMSFPWGVLRKNSDIETRDNTPQTRSGVTDCGSDIKPTKMPDTINGYVPETTTKIDPTPAPNSRPGLPTPSPTEPEVINNTDSSKVPSINPRVNL